MDGDVVILSVADALRKAFPQLEAYTSKVEQGVKKPCFFVLCENVTARKELNNRVLLSYQICVEYLPGEEAQYHDLANIANKVMATLSLIPLSGGGVRGTEQLYQIAGKMLKNTVVYTLQSLLLPEGHIPSDPAEKMGQLQSSTTLSGGRG